MITPYDRKDKQGFLIGAKIQNKNVCLTKREELHTALKEMLNTS
jgi:hypothetical protein